MLLTDTFYYMLQHFGMETLNALVKFTAVGCTVSCL